MRNKKVNTKRKLDSVKKQYERQSVQCCLALGNFLSEQWMIPLKHPEYSSEFEYNAIRISSVGGAPSVRETHFEGVDKVIQKSFSFKLARRGGIKARRRRRPRYEKFGDRNPGEFVIRILL